MKTDQKKSGRDWGIIKKKDKSGVVWWYARIVRTEPDGTKKQYTRKAENKSEAKRLRDELSEKHKSGGQKILEGDRLTFKEFAADYKQRKITPPKYHNNRKVAGLRSHRTAENFLKALLSHFGNKRIKEITPAEIERFKQKRLDTPIVTKTKNSEVSKRPRSIAGVNRELALLRAMLNDAVYNGWLNRSPFVSAKLVSLSDEVRRERVLSYAEEARLLAACSETIPREYERRGKKIIANQKSNREHLRPLLVAALDTAMRAGELLTLRWHDVDLETRTINILAFNTKTAKARTVGMTQRVYEALKELWEQSPKDAGELVFGIKNTVKRAFTSACRDAEITNFKFHDCRHTAITRMIQAGIPAMEVMKVSGHTSINTFARYVNPNSGAVTRIADVLSNYHTHVAADLVREYVN